MLGDWLSNEVSQLGDKQKIELAEKSGVSIATIYRIQAKGGYNTKVVVLEALAEALGWTIGVYKTPDIFTGTGTNQSNGL